MGKEQKFIEVYEEFSKKFEDKKDVFDVSVDKNEQDLNQNINGNQNQKKGIKNIMSEQEVLSYRRQYKKIMEKDIQDAKEKENTTKEELSKFKLNALNHGWTPSDMPLMEELFNNVQKMPNATKQEQKARKKAQETLNAWSGVSVISADARNIALGNLTELAANSPTAMEKLEKSLKRKVQPAEFNTTADLEKKVLNSPYFLSSKDKNFTEGDIAKEQAKKLREENVISENDRRRKQQKKSIRTKEDYVVSQATQKELDTHRQNVSQKHYNSEMRTHDALKIVMGENVYDDIDKLRKSKNKEERTVDLHHSRGTAQLQSGENVLEIDFAGSDFWQPRKEHKGHHGKEKTVDTAEIRAQYGSPINQDPYFQQKYPDISTKNREKILSKVTQEQVNGKTVTKQRISIPGPISPVSADTGDYCIDKNQEFATKVIKKFIKDQFEDWKRAPESEKNKQVHINLTGHSRGAVAAGETSKNIYDWMENDPANKNDKDFQKFRENIKGELLQREAVTGQTLDSKKYKNLDLSNCKNLNVTSIYSMNADKKISIPVVGGIVIDKFAPQITRGQKRIIIGNTPHSAGLETIDMSQRNVEGDGKAHQSGYLDAENKQFYRGSGLSEMPEGIYISDEKNNLVRITKYSQIDEVINVVNGDNPTQKQRQNDIRTVVKNWLLDNPKQIRVQNDTMDSAMTGILNSQSNNPAFSDVRNAVQMYNNGDMPKEAMLNPLTRYIENAKVDVKGQEAIDMKNITDLYCQINSDINKNPQRQLDQKINTLKNNIVNERGINLKRTAAELAVCQTLKSKNLKENELEAALKPENFRKGVSEMRKREDFNNFLKGKSDIEIGQMAQNAKFGQQFIKAGSEYKKSQDNIQNNTKNSVKELANKFEGKIINKNLNP